MSLLAVIFVMNLIRDCGGEGEMTRPAGTTRVPVATLHPQPPRATPTNKELAAANMAAAVEATRIAADNQKARELLAQFIEKGLLNQMIDAHVSAIGPQKKKLKIQWILMTRPWAIREMDDQEFVGSMVAAGFKEVTFTNGSQSWGWEIGKGK